MSLAFRSRLSVSLRVNQRVSIRCFIVLLSRHKARKTWGQNTQLKTHSARRKSVIINWQFSCISIRGRQNSSNALRFHLPLLLQNLSCINGGLDAIFLPWCLWISSQTRYSVIQTWLLSNVPAQRATLVGMTSLLALYLAAAETTLFNNNTIPR